eukprot:gene4981-8575_t
MFFYFSQNERDTPYLYNGTHYIPKHYITSSPIQFLLNSTGKIPECNSELNIAGRLLAQHSSIFIIASGFYIFLGFLFMLFRNHQPLKSRFIGPFIALGLLYFNLFSEYLLNFFTFEESTKFYCEFTGFFVYASIQASLTIPTIMMVRYILMLIIHQYKRKLIRKLRNNTLTSNLTKKSEKIQNYFQVVLKLISSQYAYLLVPILWGALFETIIFIVYVLYGLNCSTEAAFAIRIAHLCCIALFCTIICISISFDLFMNARNIFCGNWYEYLIKNDPYNYRLDMICIFFVIPLCIFWVSAPVPYIIRGLIVDLIFLVGFWACGLQALIITITQCFFRTFKEKMAGENFKTKKRSLTTKMTTFDFLGEGNLLETFIEFTELEWSSENIFFKMDVVAYKKYKPNSSERMNICQLIKTRYLQFSHSTLEINATESEIIAVVKKIDARIFEDELFDKLEKIVENNLSDTMSRFLVSNLYSNYQIEQKKNEKSLGLI